jgi:S1-C subfamily serine protease
MRAQLWKPLFALTIFIVIRQVMATPSSVKVIYGDDGRVDWYQVSDQNVRDAADSTVALIRAANLTQSGAVTNISTVSYGQGMGLCPGEPFYNQETAAFCSGFLVAPDTIVTAGHCISDQASCVQTRMVFGFKLSQKDVNPRSVPTDHVYSCATVVHSVSVPTGEDFAVVKLDRPVTDFPPLTYRTTGKISVGDALHVIGHPAGLPVKVAGGAQVRAVQDQFLVANLDTYGGNSGSAVFNSVTGEVEGILVRGETDFVYQNGCRTSNRCPDTGCRGEDVTLFERVLPYIK